MKIVQYEAQQEDDGAEWVRVAAREFPQLRTISKAKRERKRGVLQLNGACSAAANGRGVRTVENALPLLLQQPRRPPAAAEIAAGLMPPRAVHRLDARVGGVLLVAKTREAETRLAAQFEAHQVLKQYRAIVAGRVDPEQLLGAPALPRSMLAPLGAVSGDLRFVDAPVGGRRSCSAIRVSGYSRSERYEWITTVDLWPLTGRKHQLREHMAQLGHPVVGDDLFARHDGAVDAAGAVRGRGLFLYAIALAFDDGRGNRRRFAIDEPLKFARFRHFCAHNWATAAARRHAADTDADTDAATAP
ncbi:hypothetical protein PybrP1_000254 [[Pythium] brassicae (nom. inval.)]|nr:hypothetical protein PybrP1_000254 [[Pythium] brassicae (nom. inval.)]